MFLIEQKLVVQPFTSMRSFDCNIVLSFLQFSSLGSLDEKWMAEFASSMSSGLSEDKTPLGPGEPLIIWPTVEDVRCSLEVLYGKLMWIWLFYLVLWLECCCYIPKMLVPRLCLFYIWIPLNRIVDTYTYHCIEIIQVFMQIIGAKNPTVSLSIENIINW